MFVRCAAVAGAGAQTSLLLNLVYSEIKGFSCPSYDIPWLVRSATVSKEVVRSQLGLSAFPPVLQSRLADRPTNRATHAGQTQRYCLYSFGGHTFPLDKVQEWQVGCSAIDLGRTRTLLTPHE
jgi:hypothetical protein